MKRRRGAVESLLSIVLILEALLAFFLTLVVFALDTLPPAAAFGGGGVLLLALVATSRVVRHSWGVWIGWGLQVALVATGFLQPFMFVIGAGFAALWIYCFVTGTRLDRRNAQFSFGAVDDPAESGGTTESTDDTGPTGPSPDSPTDPSSSPDQIGKS